MNSMFWEGPLHGTLRDVSAHLTEYYASVRPSVSVRAFDPRATAQCSEPSPTRHVYRRDRTGDFTYVGQA